MVPIENVLNSWFCLQVMGCLHGYPGTDVIDSNAALKISAFLFHFHFRFFWLLLMLILFVPFLHPFGLVYITVTSDMGAGTSWDWG